MRATPPAKLALLGTVTGCAMTLRLVIGRCLAVVATLAVLTAGRSHAGTVFISDFTSGAIAAQGGDWVWTSAQRTLTVAGSNTSSDYLQHLGLFPAIDITGGTSLRLIGSWVPTGDSDSFLIDLLGNGNLVTRATFTYDQFANGPNTIEASLTPLQSSLVDQWQLVGNGNSNTAFGDLQLTGMSVVTVPEPSTYAMALAGLACGGYSLFRRRRVR